MLNREQILAATQKPAGRLRIDEWGGEVGVKRLTLDEVQQIDKLEQEGGFDALRKIAALVMVNDCNLALFDPGDTELSHLGYSTLRMVEAAVLEANYLTEESRERLKKNCEAALICSTSCD